MNKRIIIVLFLLFGMVSYVFSQESVSEPARYRLYKTENFWTFLKLDTMTGQIWQVQYSINGSAERLESVLNLTDITDELELPKIVGRYTLYATTNTYNFIMLDQIDGYTFQVQWNIDRNSRFVIPIVSAGQKQPF